MSVYVNPNHPAGILFEQPHGALGGGRSRGAQSRDRVACLPLEEKDPTAQSILEAEREAMRQAVRGQVD